MTVVQLPLPAPNRPAKHRVASNPAISSAEGRLSGLRYLGSKARLADWICSILGGPLRPESRFVDVFSGTGIVSKKAVGRGWAVLANDHLNCAHVMTRAHLASEQSCRFVRLGGYQAAISHLNASEGTQGFVWREYSPSGQSRSRHVRYYFTPENAAKIDTVRRQIDEWKSADLISPEEEAVLIADLLNAANRVANIAGTYGCFLRPWQRNALKHLTVLRRLLLPIAVPSEVLCVDASEIPALPHDVAYLDPPYTKRQHAAYYHILETIALGDQPEVGGKTGLRPWQHRSSDFCYRARAKRALRKLLAALPCNRILLSYSSEGHLKKADVLEVLSQFGRVTEHRVMAVPRYRSNEKASRAGSNVEEYLFDMVR